MNFWFHIAIFESLAFNVHLLLYRVQSKGTHDADFQSYNFYGYDRQALKRLWRNNRSQLREIATLLSPCFGKFSINVLFNIVYYIHWH